MYLRDEFINENSFATYDLQLKPILTLRLFYKYIKRYIIASIHRNDLEQASIAKSIERKSV